MGPKGLDPASQILWFLGPGRSHTFILKGLFPPPWPCAGDQGVGEPWLVFPSLGWETPISPPLSGFWDLSRTHRPERAVFRLRKWIILRLVSIVDNLHVEKEEALIEEVARSGPEMCLNPNFPWVRRPLV